MTDVDKKMRLYAEFLKGRGLKSTRQRDLILEEFFRKHDHRTVDEIWAQVRRKNPRIGYATVYRTLKLLTESGLAHKQDFGGGQSRFEQETEHHHDHLICMDCGGIVEFENETIENLQEKVAQQYGFRLIRHRMELYGYCRQCDRKKHHV